ncbi:MAG: acyl--CoA ligase [Bacilli bacterium]|nr:acyl--CoA ligase [Bacilli bacterium]
MSIFDIFTVKKKIPAPWKKYYTKKNLRYKIPDITMYDQVAESALAYPRNVAIQYMGKKINYMSFLKKINICANGFNELGVKKGDIVTILLPNVPEALISLYALNKLGAIANMTHPLSAEEEIKQTLESTKSKYLIIYDAQYDKIKSFIKDTSVKRVIFVSPGDSLNFIKGFIYDVSQLTKFEHHPKDRLYINWKRFMLGSKFVKGVSPLKLGKNTPAVIIHSGGTSGTPKNVVIQNRAFIFAAKGEEIDLIRLNQGDSALAIMPNFHGFGLSVLMHTPLALGCSTILVPKFDAKKFDVLFNKTKPTCVLGVPTLFEALINSNNVKNLDLSFLKYVISGGDLLPKNLEDEINEYLEKHNSTARITQGYGLSEALACVTMAHDDVNKSGSVGIPLAGNYIKIIDDERKIVPYGETGEIVINSKALMMGYLDNEKETNEVLQIHDDGHVWLHTGDLGYMDEDGFLFYKGRIKRMIITSGYNVYPSHVEEVIEKHPAVLQCSVIGVPHPYKQQVPKAFVVLKEGNHGLLVKQELKAYCKKNLAKYMIPYEIVIRKQLPKTKLGKVDFKVLQNDAGEDEYE